MTKQQLESQAPPGDGPIREAMQQLADAEAVLRSLISNGEDRAVDLARLRDAGAALRRGIDLLQAGKMENALRESEGKYRALVEMSPEAVAVHCGGKLVFVNSAGAKMLGAATPADLIGMPVLDFVHPDYRELVGARVRDLNERGIPAPLVEEKFIRLDGSIIDVETAGIPTTFEGEPAVQVVFRDVTDRKRAQEELRESEERFRIMADSSPIILWVTNAEGGIRFVNRLYREFFGVTYEQVEGGKWQPLVHPEDGPTYVEAFFRHVREHTSFQGEARVRRADGEWRWIASVAEVRFSAGGEFLGHVGITLDITERKQAEEALRESEEKYRELVENANSIIIKMDRAGIITFFNDYAQKFFGYSLGEILGQNAKILVPPIESRSGRSLEEMADNVFRDPDAFIENINENIRKNGERVWISWTNKGIRDAEGNIVGNLTIGQDVTGRIKAEEALRRQAQITAALEERQRLARELHDSVSQALYGIALGTRTARSRLGQDPGQLIEPLDYIVSLAEVALSDMRALIFDLRPETLATEGLVSALTKRAIFVEHRQGIQVVLDLCDEPAVSLDIKEGLYSIAREALHNVVKHALASRVSIGLTQNADGLALVVGDNGVGFDPGGEYPGHFGLESMRERAAYLRGCLTVESATGRGTRIAVQVPVDAVHVAGAL